MIDHLLKAADQPTLIAAIGSHNPDGRGPLWNAGGGPEHVPAGWRGDIAFACTVTDNTDPNNPVLLTDYHLWVSLPAQDATLSANADCILVANRDAALAGVPNFILQASLTLAQMQVFTISPVVAGSNYPFGSSST